MSKPKHTQGPLHHGEVQTSYANIACRIFDQYGWQVGTAGWPPSATAEECEANARLWAASPDLLQAAINAEAILNASDIPNKARCVELLRAAIAKASGGDASC